MMIEGYAGSIEIQSSLKELIAYRKKHNNLSSIRKTKEESQKKRERNGACTSYPPTSNIGY